MIEDVPFEPWALLSHRDAQTLCSNFFSSHFEPPTEIITVDLLDKERLALCVSTPKNWKNEDLTVLMLHGLGGSDRSPYLVRLSKKFFNLGIRAVRYNCRGCGRGKNLARKTYHAGQSEDLLCAIKKIRESSANLIVIGFSLGGNIALKLAGELGSCAKEFFKKLMAISPPIDLFSTMQKISLPENEFYEHYFLRLLIEDANLKMKRFSEYPKIIFPKKIDFPTFDSLYTAPLNGFKDAFDYYEKCSAKKVISQIAVPTKVLLAKDDPIIPYDSFEEIPPCMEVFLSEKGGHLGFLGNPLKREFRFMDKLLISWCRS